MQGWGRYKLVVSEHPGFDSDPPIRSDQRRGVTQLIILFSHKNKLIHNILQTYTLDIVVAGAHLRREMWSMFFPTYLIK